MWITYSDSEVHTFHPICEKALNGALKRLGLTGEYEVLHHQRTGALEMDFVIRNKITKKYLCVIEVKRKPSDIQSMRYQYQAMSYVQMNASMTEQPFYMLTNLEYALAFRYDPSRSRVVQQVIEPGLIKIGSFADYSQTDFTKLITSFFTDQIRKYRMNQFDYSITLAEFVAHMEAKHGHLAHWSVDLAFLLYEYIRGSFDSVKRSPVKDIRVFSNSLRLLCAEMSPIDFKALFTVSEVPGYDPGITSGLLTQLYEYGKQNINGESISNALHQIVASGKEHEGVVQTDQELSRILACLARISSGMIHPHEKIIDPAAGSGSLLCAAVDEYQASLDQIVANDILPQFGQLLSLRLGLMRPETVSTPNAPTIFSMNIAKLEQSVFQDVKVVLMNPPFVSGINAIPRKEVLYERIRQITKDAPLTSVGQMPLEGPFIELITILAEPGTTIACILPITHLTATGIEAQTLRRLLLGRFGLKLIFTYPGTGIFDSVQKETCIVIGKIGQRFDSIHTVSSHDPIPDIDLHRFSEAVSAEHSAHFQSIMPGVEARRISSCEMRNTVEQGWRTLNSGMVDALSFVEERILSNPCLCPLGELGLNAKRGNVGNKGASDLVFVDSVAELLDALSPKGLATMPGMRNAELEDFLVNKGDSQVLVHSLNSPELIDKAIQMYLALPTRVGRQRRSEKSATELLSILKDDTKETFSAVSVLIPRNLRVYGKAYLATNEIYASTNFLVIHLLEYDHAVVLATWATTVFYQLLCELTCKNQEGTRKMEVRDILSTYAPKFEEVSSITRKRLQEEVKRITFLDLQCPTIREVDVIWAKELFGKESDELLIKARNQLELLARKRNPERQ